MVIFNKITFALLLTISGNILSSADEENEHPIVELKQGKLRGLKETSTDGREFYSFMGIPFAKPPIHNLRFENPVKLDKWEKVIEAHLMPEMCLQLDLMRTFKGQSEKVIGSEDCLYLNVFTPKPIDIESNLPVMVFIHGGGFMTGSASLYQPYVLLNEDIVLVVIQYRLGTLGFLSTEDSYLPGNLGLKDQRMALQWVQENIKSFGGNSDQVTIFGESAGAGSVHLHMLSPGSKGLFHGVIAQSGTSLCQWNIGNQHYDYAKQYGEKVGCSLSNNGEIFKECLKCVNETTLTLGMGLFHKWGFFPLIVNPRVDGDFLPDDPEVLLKTMNYNKVNLMNGVTRDEGVLYAAMVSNPSKWKELLIQDFDTYSPHSVKMEWERDAANLSKIIHDFYLKGKNIEDASLAELIELYSDSNVNMCTDLTSLIHAQDKDINLYLYELDHRGQRSSTDPLEIPDFPQDYIVHGDDLIYLFSGGPLFSLPLERKEDIELRRKITKMWTNFSKYGNPTPPGSFDFQWNPATFINFKHLSITTMPTMKSYTRREKLNFWKTLNTRQNRLLFPSAENGLPEKKVEL